MNLFTKTKESILEKWLTNYPWQWDSKKNTLEAMEEYKNQFIVSEEEKNEKIFEIWKSMENKVDMTYENGFKDAIEWFNNRLKEN
jgi:hypothetical protein